MRIRRATKKDFKRIAELFRKEYSKPPYNEKWNSNSSLKKIKTYFNSKKIILVVEGDKEVVGFLIGNIYLSNRGKRGFIDQLVVGYKYQGKGFGGKLMDYFESYLKSKGIRRVGLDSLTKSKAFKFYKKKGYKVEEKYVSMTKELKWS